jgi:hypothetical protein
MTTAASVRLAAAPRTPEMRRFKVYFLRELSGVAAEVDPDVHPTHPITGIRAV